MLAKSVAALRMTRPPLYLWSVPALLVCCGEDGVPYCENKLIEVLLEVYIILRILDFSFFIEGQKNV